MVTNIPVNDGGHLIVSISVVHWCQSTTACHNVVDCFQAYTAHAASRTDISMQNVALIILTMHKFLSIYLSMSFSYCHISATEYNNKRLIMQPESFQDWHLL